MTEIISVGIAFDPSGSEAGVTAAEAQFDRLEERAGPTGPWGLRRDPSGVVPGKHVSASDPSIRVIYTL
ncbi:MAG: hypothetical protein O7E49_10365 [Gemmatimonadetes bacterium]|nr:hypothetical protein [Gemmatimonadota bacterium]